MTQPGRRSIEARSVVNVSGPRERLKPPPELTGTRREIFLDISAVPPEAFRPSDLPLYALTPVLTPTKSRRPNASRLKAL